MPPSNRDFVRAGEVLQTTRTEPRVLNAFAIDLPSCISRYVQSSGVLSQEEQVAVLENSGVGWIRCHELGVLSRSGRKPGLGFLSPGKPRSFGRNDDLVRRMDGLIMAWRIDSIDQKFLLGMKYYQNWFTTDQTNLSISRIALSRNSGRKSKIDFMVIKECSAKAYVILLSDKLSIVYTRVTSD